MTSMMEMAETTTSTGDESHNDDTAYDNNPLLTCSEIDMDNVWICLEAEVIQLWESPNDSIAQIGLLADDTDTIKFVSWEKSNLPEIEKGESYRFNDIITDEYEGRYSINLNSATGISHLEGDNAISTSSDASTSIERSGAIVAVQYGSGLITRCTEDDCSYVLRDNTCPNHGHVDGEHDLRVKAVLDDGVETQSIVLNAEATTDITDTTIDEAKQMAMDALDTSVVVDEFRSQLIGRYFTVEGPEVGEYHFINQISEQGSDSND